eukprot:gnl/TRDRNA2_/TRDRNA2_75142_c0_seq4.p1 gnl/TRDRNA2_/TRDRNA2_75142_c0~~gnl/TRDRNA2_/TRDRNA2_75142_c0_seq4.p1  ORF type:complete len:256 (-),score=39.10 gnl/TRDRNA2_/TRDRNA2_75142_c0_seq4:55-822(-)
MCCDGCCRPLRKAAENACACWGRPLGFFVFGTLLMSCLMAIAAAVVLLTRSLDHKEVYAVCQYPIRFLLLTDVFLSALQTGFALHVQMRIWAEMCNLVDREDDEPGMLRLTTGGTLLQAAKSLAHWNNKPAILYAVLLVGTFTWNVFGWYMAQSSEECNPGALPSLVAALGMAQPVSVVLYVASWLVILQCHECMEACCHCCGGFECCVGKKPAPARIRDDGSSYAEDESMSEQEPNGGWLSTRDLAIEARSRWA